MKAPPLPTVDTSIPPSLDYIFKMENGVGHYYLKEGKPHSEEDPIIKSPEFTKESFISDWNRVLAISVHGPM